MIRKFSVGILIFCFGISNVNLGWAAEAMEAAPIIVQPGEIQELNQQMIDRDRQNRDEEFKINQLIEENNKLTQSTLASQEDEGLAKINQTMLSYREAQVSRDRARIVANGERGWTSRYGDLIALTEDADAMTVHQDLESRSDMLAEKYQMLTQLKDEMAALNARLNERQQGSLNQNESANAGLNKIGQQQQDKIQTLVAQLGAMDQKINHLDEIIAEKDRQIAQLQESLSIAQQELSVKNETIKDQENQIAALQSTTKNPSSSPTIGTALPPIIVNPSDNQQTITGSNPASALAQIQVELSAKEEIIKQQQKLIAILQSTPNAITSPEANPSLAAKDEAIQEKQNQVDLLKSELENKITELNGQGRKDEIIKQQEDQIAMLKAQAQDLSSKEELIKSQADQMARASEQFNKQGAVYANVQNQVMALRDKMQAQALDLKAKNESIRWLNEVLDVAKKKAEYYQLTSQQDQLTMKQVQDEVQNIKDDFSQRFKNYDQFESAIGSLKSQVNQLGLQLSQKQGQVDLLQSELKDKITQEQDQKDQVVKMKADILEILQVQANKEIYRRNAKAQVDDRVQLAKQLIDLQWQETTLLDEKGNLEAALNDLFDQHAITIEKKIKGLLITHQIQTADLQNRLEELKDGLSQKEQEIGELNTELKNKIAEEKNQGVLADQLQDLKAQLQDKEDLIAMLKKEIQEGQVTKEEEGSLKQQLAAQQDQVNQLKQQLENKTVQSDQMTAMLSEYQKKLESKDNAFNKQLGLILSSKNYQVQLEKQVSDIGAQLQEKEAEVVKVKKEMYDLQELTGAKERDIQTKDLNLSMIQQKTLDDKINEYQGEINGLRATTVRQVKVLTRLRNELALARQQLKGMPSSDELDFLRTGLQKATLQLKKKDQALTQIKIDFDEYAKEFKSQSQEFQSLKDQLLNAQHEINRRDEDLKYRDLAIIRLKEISRKSESNLKTQVRVLTLRVNTLEKELVGKVHTNKVEALQGQLKYANLQIKDLNAQLDRLKSPSRNDPLEEKLQQALDKIDEQGRTINTLVQKLQDAGQSAELTKDAGK